MGQSNVSGGAPLHGENFSQPVLGSPGFVFLNENGLPDPSVALN